MAREEASYMASEKGAYHMPERARPSRYGEDKGCGCMQVLTEGGYRDQCWYSYAITAKWSEYFKFLLLMFLGVPMSG